MKSKFQFFTLLFLSAFVLFLNLSPMVFAQSTDNKTPQQRCEDFYKGFSIDSKSNAVEGLPQYCTVNQIGTTIINVVLALAGSALVLFIIVGGFLLITAGGNEEQSEKGKKVMTNAVLGMVVVIMAFSIVKIITNTLTGDIGKNISSSSSGNSNSTQPPASGSQNPSATPSGSVDVQAKIDAATKNLLNSNSFVIPAEALAGHPYIVSALITRSRFEEDLKTICGVSDIGSNVAMTVSLNDKVLGNPGALVKNATSYTASVNIPMSDLGTGGDLIIRICDVPVSFGSVSVK
jgi:hypothetical protein